MGEGEGGRALSNAPCIHLRGDTLLMNTVASRASRASLRGWIGRREDQKGVSFAIRGIIFSAFIPRSVVARSSARVFICSFPREWLNSETRSFLIFFSPLPPPHPCPSALPPVTANKGAAGNLHTLGLPQIARWIRRFETIARR